MHSNPCSVEPDECGKRVVWKCGERPRLLPAPHGDSLQLCSIFLPAVSINKEHLESWRASLNNGGGGRVHIL